MGGTSKRSPEALFVLGGISQYAGATIAVQLFDDVPSMLRDLADAGLQLAMVSSNAEDNVRQILGPATAALFASFECGMSIFGKAARLNNVLRQLGVAAVDALYRIDGQVLRFREVGFVFLRMDAVHRTSVHTSGIFRSDAGFSDDVGHFG